MVKSAAIATMVLLAGCGFSPLSYGDGGAPINPGQAGTGPGPLGALYQGVCCARDGECSSRRCAATGAGPKFCTKLCDADENCNSYSAEFHCDPSTHVCAPVNPTSYHCVDPSQSHYGARPTGACCQQSAKTFETCQGGICIATGMGTNPLICSQGCDASSPCPIGWSCAARAFGFITDFRECWKDPTVQDPNSTYTCQP